MIFPVISSIIITDNEHDKSVSNFTIQLIFVKEDNYSSNLFITNKG
jgi:hypothetical protein